MQSFMVSNLAENFKNRPLTSHLNRARNLSRQTNDVFRSEFGGRSSAQESSASAML